MNRIYVDWNAMVDGERVRINTYYFAKEIESMGGLFVGMRLLADDGEVEHEIVVEKEGDFWLGRIDSETRYLDEGA